MYIWFPPSLPPYHGKNHSLLSLISRHRAQRWDQITCTLAVQPQHPHAELMVSTGMEGLSGLEDGLGTLSCAQLLPKSTELIFHVLGSKQHHSRWRGW